MNEKFNKETKICEKEPSEVLEMYISIAKLNTHTHTHTYWKATLTNYTKKKRIISSLEDELIN
jgi:hypothetical protein